MPSVSLNSDDEKRALLSGYLYPIDITNQMHSKIEVKVEGITYNDIQGEDIKSIDNAAEFSEILRVGMDVYKCIHMYIWYVFMYVCLYVCMYACIYVCIYVCMYVCSYICIYVCMYAFMYVFMNECMYVRMYVCMYEWMYVCMYVCVYVCVYVCMYVCMYVCIYIFIFMHVYININMIVLLNYICMKYIAILIYAISLNAFFNSQRV